MTKLNNIVFINSYPSLDLHGFDRETARVAIDDFIKDNQKMGNEIIVIVHGIGSGILQKQTHKTLRDNKNVLDYKLYYYNNGCTVAEIKKTINNKF